jgi:hypothetical protein
MTEEVKSSSGEPHALPFTERTVTIRNKEQVVLDYDHHTVGWQNESRVIRCLLDETSTAYRPVRELLAIYIRANTLLEALADHLGFEEGSDQQFEQFAAAIRSERDTLAARIAVLEEEKQSLHAQLDRALTGQKAKKNNG